MKIVKSPDFEKLIKKFTQTSTFINQPVGRYI